MSLGLHHLTVRVGERTVCRDLNLDMKAGQCWAVLGANGVGKSTLLAVLAGLRPADAGEVHLLGRGLTQWSRRDTACQIGLMTQGYHDAFVISALELTLQGRFPHLGPWQREGEFERSLARQALADVGLAGFEQRRVQTLSGGERRRLALATVLCQQPAVYLLDEPANDLDLHHQALIFQHMQALARQQGRLVVMVLHDPNHALRFCDHALLLQVGQAPEAVPVEALDDVRLGRLYGHRLSRMRDADGRLFVGL